MSSEWPPGRPDHRFDAGDRNGRRPSADPEQFRSADPGEDTAEWRRVDWPGATGGTPRFDAFGAGADSRSRSESGFDSAEDAFGNGGWPRGFDRFADQAEPELPEAEPAPLVRPYARTGGRTRASQDLALETLVSVTEQGRVSAPLLSADQAAICGLCESPISVAEVGARLRVPLGVARVLLSDLASSGLIVVHDSAVHAGDAPSLDFMERVLVGLRNL